MLQLVQRNKQVKNAARVIKEKTNNAQTRQSKKKYHPVCSVVCYSCSLDGISTGRPGGLITEITWNPGRLEVICRYVLYRLCAVMCL